MNGFHLANRALEESIAGSIPVQSDKPLVITKGNYLLLDEAWYLDLDPRRALHPAAGAAHALRPQRAGRPRLDGQHRRAQRRPDWVLRDPEKV